MLKSCVPFLVLVLAISQSAGLSISVPSFIIRGQNATVKFTRNSDDLSAFTVGISDTLLSFSVNSGGQTTWQQELEYSVFMILPIRSYTMEAFSGNLTLYTSNEFSIVDPNPPGPDSSTSSAATSDSSSSSAAGASTTATSSVTVGPAQGDVSFSSGGVSTTGASSVVGSSSRPGIVSSNITPSVTVNQTEGSTSTVTTPVSPTPSSSIPSSSRSSKIPGIIGGVIGGLIVLVILTFFMIRNRLQRQHKSNAQRTRSTRQLNPALVSSVCHIEPFTNTPTEGSNTQGEKRLEQRDEVARLQEQLEQATSSAHSSFTGPSEESPLVLELRGRIQELTELLSPPAYEDVPEC